MDLKLLSRGDGMVLAGFAAMLLGTSLSWYAAVTQYVEGTLKYGVSGWSYTLGWLSWLCALAAVLVVLNGVLAKPAIDFGGKAATIVCGLGAVALLLVIIGLFSKPSFEEITMRLVGNFDTGMFAKASRAADWTNEIDSAALSLGIFVSLIGAGLVTLGGFIKTVDPVRAAVPAPAPVPLAAPAPTAPAASAAAAAALPAAAPAATPAEAPAPAATPAEAPAPAGADEAVAGSAPESDAAADWVVRFCASCGAVFADDQAAFCVKCGAKRYSGSDEGADQ